ncbi:unnamed protein product [Rhizoctonia solani]|uniref:C2H2-type domain-containing protein n=1 Tax=Rhizoctonia solani TaxID=456999 RepID=A0A8H2XCG6_9AGAM|nr:unnamed protein product [Rhizoctonia solani]
MSFSVEIPLSCVRSTLDKTPSSDKPRRRPTFSLHLDINIARSFRDTSQSTTPALSPSQSCTLPLSPFNSLPHTPVALTDTTNRWSNRHGRSPTESFPASLFVPWTNHDDLHFDFSNSSWEHAPAYNSTKSRNKDNHTLCVHHQPIFTPHPHSQGIPSVPQEGTGIEQGLSTRVINDDSPRVVPRLLEPRSSRPRDAFEGVPSAAPRDSSHFKGNPHPQLVVSANYRQLSAREMNDMQLDPHRRYYKCLVDSCDRLFGRKSNVENHIRTHLDDKPFVCSLSTCQSAFVRKGDLLRHKEIHRPSRVHTCSW